MIINGNTIKKHKFLKLLILCTILTLFSCSFFNIMNYNIVLAAQNREPYSSKINNYPGYKELIDKLKKEHPNWNFTILYTGLDWNEVIKNETTEYHGRNVVPASWSSEWKCKVCGDKPQGGSSWRCASEAAVKYYMDPRNWLNDTYVFQFENLGYNGNIQTIQGVQKIISSIKYMQGDKVTYTKTDGTKGTLNKSYAQVIMDAAKEAGISPYHLASRIRQEQGTGSTPGATASGTYSGYVGYYNFLNIKASGSTDTEVNINGLQHAKNNGWTNPEISIKAGAKVLAQNYIKGGQDTIYLQKFDVDNSDGTLYWHQYMQNVAVCLSEGTMARKAYQDLGMLNSPIDFVIPVYENMPRNACPDPTKPVLPNNSVSYRTHIENIGWQSYVSNGTMAGTTGKSLRLEGINIKLENMDYSGDITYQTHIQNIGWQPWKKNGDMAGTSGQSLRLEAIKIKLTGEIANHYDVYYRVHCQEFGWMDWAKNGEAAGSSGYSYRLEGIEIRLVKKGLGAPGKTDRPFSENLISYATHVENIG